jgi:hypothetical protein
MGIATPLSTSGRFIVDAHGRRVRPAGVNWIGAHMDDGVAPGLNPAHARGTNPVSGRRHFDWGQPATDGLLTEDWSGVASPAIMEILQSLMPPRTGPGIS